MNYLIRLYCILIFLFSGFVYSSCEHSAKKQANPLLWEKDIASKTLPELIKAGYEYRNDKDSFPKICHFLNDSIADKDIGAYYLTPLIIHEYELVDSCEKLISVDWGFLAIDEMQMGRGEGTIIVIDLDNHKAYIGYDTFDISNVINIGMLAEKYLFDADTMRWIYKRDVDFFGNVEIFGGHKALFEIDMSNGRNLSMDEWSQLFEYMHELIVVFDKKQDAIAIQKWGQNFTSLPIEKKIAIMEIVHYNISIRFVKSSYNN